MHAIISAQDVHFAYGKVKALRGIDLEVKAGEVIAILGPNGAGKTTFIETLMGSIRPDKGKIEVFGKHPTDFKAAEWSRIGLVQQYWKDHAKWRVLDHLKWIKHAHESVGAQTLDPIEELERHGLGDKQKAKLISLSGGQRRRVDFIAATLANPKLLLLDEPATGLDPEAKAGIHDTIMASADRGSTVLLTTHDLYEAEKIASRIIIIKNGTIIADGTGPQLREHLRKPAEVSWKQDGQKHVHATETVEQFIKTLDLDNITGLTITRPTMEDAYIALVNDNKSAKTNPLHHAGTHENSAPTTTETGGTPATEGAPATEDAAVTEGGAR